MTRSDAPVRILYVCSCMISSYDIFLALYAARSLSLHHHDIYITSTVLRTCGMSPPRPCRRSGQVAVRTSGTNEVKEQEGTLSLTPESAIHFHPVWSLDCIVECGRGKHGHVPIKFE